MDMKTETHVHYIVQKCYKRLWAIRKLKSAGVSSQDILRYYFMKIRSVLESSCSVFHSMITVQNSDDIERIQKIIFRIVLGPAYDSYEDACKLLNVDSLKQRRLSISLSFGLKLLDSSHCTRFFKFSERKDIFLRKQPILVPPFAHTERYKNSPLPFLTRILNNFFEQKIKKKDYTNIPSRFFPIAKVNNGL